mmetsp:Transcript_26673/g.62655  ORF Transcript_26673/g.62655 Transcript_26673/m.62655 type:complete len:233 (-) Transcript_26673:346-1044(-)
MSSSRSRSKAIETTIENTKKSKNIPLPLSHTHRTQSEIQLCEDMETAEQRDWNMFYRLVNGIRERQMNLVRENESSIAAAAFHDPAHALTEAERSLAHIIHTRNAPVDKKNCVSAAAPFKINSVQRNSGNNFLNKWHTNLNSGIMIPEDDPDSMYQHEYQQEKMDHEDGWAVGGFDSSANFSIDHWYQQQHYSRSTSNLGMTGAVTSTLTTTLPTKHSSNEMTEEGMFDFEL